RRHPAGRARRATPGGGEGAGLGARRPPRAGRGDVVVVVGIPAAGKSRIAAGYEADGYVRLNRDERGGSLKALGEALDEALAAGERRVVLDNTYLTRAARSYTLEAAAAHRLPVRCVWLDTPLAQAQGNPVGRLLDRVGYLPEPEQRRTLAREPGLLLPTSQMRAVRELEPPDVGEGFADVQRLEFVRSVSPGRAGVFVAASALDGWGGRGPDLV